MRNGSVFDVFCSFPAALGGAFCIHFYWEVNELPNERTIQAKKEIVDQLKGEAGQRRYLRRC